MSRSKLAPHKGQILAWKANNISDTEIAARLGVARSTLQFYLSNHTSERIPDTLPTGTVGVEEVQVVHRDYSSQDHHYVYPLGDIHKGSAVHQGDRWREWVNYLTAEPDRSMLNTGDNINAAIVGSVSDIYRETMTVGEAKREFREDIRALAEDGRVDCISKGNHEDRIIRATGDDPMFDVAEALGVPYVREAVLLVYHVGDMEYEVYMRHGTGAGQSLAQLQKSSLVANADVYVTGHTHKQAATADDIYFRNGDVMERRHRYYVSSGSFMGYEDYAARRGYVPTRIGAPRIFLDGRNHDIHVSI